MSGNKNFLDKLNFKNILLNVPSKFVMKHFCINSVFFRYLAQTYARVHPAMTNSSACSKYRQEQYSACSKYRQEQYSACSKYRQEQYSVCSNYRQEQYSVCSNYRQEQYSACSKYRQEQFSLRSKYR